MKKISIIATVMALLMASLFTMSASAQFSVGVKAGAGLTKFSEDADNDLKTKTGLVIGALGTYQIQPKLSVQAELLYSMQGAKEGKGSYDFNYINLPLTVRYNVWNNLQLHTGPQLGFLTSAKTNYMGDKEDVKDNVKGGDFAWLLGATYELKNGFLADIRFVKGLSDISDNDSDIKNTGIQLTVGYRFGTKK